MWNPKTSKRYRIEVIDEWLQRTQLEWFWIGLSWLGSKFTSICPSLDGCTIVSQLIFLDTVIPPKKIWHSRSTLVPWLGKTYRSMKRRRIDTTTAMSAWPQNICHTTTYLHEMPNAMLRMSRSYLLSSLILCYYTQRYLQRHLLIFDIILDQL